MTQSNPNVAVALEAIAEGMNILRLLACATDNLQWIDDSVPLSKLNELAQSLGYRDAQSVHSQVEHDKDMEECHAKVRQLRADLVRCRAELAAVDAALDVERSAHRGSVLIADDVVNEVRQEVKQLQADLKLNAKLAALMTPGLAALLGRLANCTSPSEHGNAPDVRQCIKDREAARALAARIREAPALEEIECTN